MFIHMIRSILFILVSLSATRVDRAADVNFESPATRTHLLELFTSEGCSSCPPAEAWLSKLKEQPGLWREFVPIAFHVDYWDRLGWRDPFAAKQWTARQYEYSSRWQSSSVYTPGFVLNGREWRDRQIPAASKEDAGVLKIALHDDDAFSANFVRASNAARSFQVHVARLGFDLNVNVKAGENSGRKLLHDFVVLSLADAPLDGNGKKIPLPKSGSSSREAIAAWVTESGQLEPVQATGGWLR